MLEVSYVPAEEVDFVWEQILPMVERGLSHGQGDCTTPDHVLDAIKRGDMMLWTVHEENEIYAGLVLEIVQHPVKKTLFVVLLAGREMKKWIDKLERLLIDYGKHIGADAIETSCRNGLVRFLSKRGWYAKATIMAVRAN